MYGRKSKIASSRRLKAPFAHGGDAYAQQHAATNTAQQPAAGPDRHELQTRPSTAAAPQLQHSKSSKAQALAAFFGLVESASRARLGLSLPGAPVATAEAVAVAAHHSAPFEGPQGQRQNRTHPATVHKHAAGPATLDAAPQALQFPSAAAAQQHPDQPQSAVPLAVAQPTKSAHPTQLIARAISALKKLHQQLSSRTLTYLYQFDNLLQQATAAVTAVASYLTSDGTAAGSAELLQQLVLERHQQAQQQDTVRAADALLGLCRSSWEVIMLLLQHHHTAEPDNTASQAREIHGAARVLWDVYEAAPQVGLTASVTATEYSGQQDGDEGASTFDPLVKNTLLQALTSLAQVAGHWSNIADSDTSDWCYLQLRKHLFNISTASADSRLAVAERRELQQLQMNILQGNIAMVAQQGQQVLWTNLTNMLQQLLSVSLMDPEDTISHCLTLAGTLAEHAKQITAPASSSSSSSSSGGGLAVPLPAKVNSKCSDKEAVINACRILEYAVELLEYCSNQVDIFKQQQQQEGLDGGAGCQAGSNEQHMLVVKHILGIQQQVLLQLGQAYLTSKQHSKATDCVNRLRGISPGLAPPQGLIQLSILALIGQGKHMPACAQLCAWLKQSAAPSGTSSSNSSGSSSTVEEACAAVVAFLQALQRSSCDAVSVAGVVEMVADAAAQRGGGDAAVAVAVIKELLNTEVGGDAQHNSLEQLVVKLLGREETAQLIMKNPADAKCCHTMLHQHAQLHYDAHNYTAAIELLTPAVFFSTTVTAGRSARLLAMCLLKCHQPQRAIDYVSLAEQQEGQTTALGCLIRLQALLLLAAPAAAAARERLPSAAAVAAGSSNDATGVSDEEIRAAVHMLSGCVEYDSQSAQAAFSMCMQARHIPAAWEVLKTWETTPLPDKSAAAAAAAGSNHRSVQALVLMTSLYQQERHQLMSRTKSSGLAAAAAAAAVGSDLLADLCNLYGRCAAQLNIVKHASTPPAAALAPAVTAAATAVVVTAGKAEGQDVCCCDEKQLLWLVDVGIQLGTQAIEQRLLDLGAQFMQCASTCCTILQQQQQQQVVVVAAQCSQQPDASDASNVSSICNDNSSSGSSHNSVPVTAVAAVCRRHLFAQMTAVTLLLHNFDNTAGNQQQQQQQLKHARQLLDLAQQQLLLLQQVEAASSPGGLAAAAAAAADSTTTGSSSLQYLFSKIGFTVACREGDEQCMKQCLQQMVQSPHARTSDLEAAAYECIRPMAVHRCETVAALAYGYMLRVATAAVDTAAAAAGDNNPAAAAVDLAAVAAAAMGMMGLVSSHGVRIKVCSKVASTLAVARQQQQQRCSGSSAELAFPGETLQWLIITCWNAAVQLSNSNAAMAMQYLNCATALSAAQQYDHKITAGHNYIAAAGVAGVGVGADVAANATSPAKQQQQQHHWLLSSNQYRALKANLAAQLVSSDSSIVKSQPPQTAAAATADITSVHDQHDQNYHQLPAAAAAAANLDSVHDQCDQDDQHLPDDTVPAAAQDLHKRSSSLVTNHPVAATSAVPDDKDDQPRLHGSVQADTQNADKTSLLATDQPGPQELHDHFLGHPAPAAAAAAVGAQSSILAQASGSPGGYKNDSATQQDQQLLHLDQPQPQSQDVGVKPMPSSQQIVQLKEASNSMSQQQPATAAHKEQQPAREQAQQQLQQPEAEQQCQHGDVGERPSSQQCLQPRAADKSMSQQPATADHQERQPSREQVQQQLEQQEGQCRNGYVEERPSSQQSLQPIAADHSEFQRASRTAHQEQQAALEYQNAAADASADLLQQQKPSERKVDDSHDIQQIGALATLHQQQQFQEGSKQDQQSQQQQWQSQQQQGHRTLASQRQLGTQNTSLLQPPPLQQQCSQTSQGHGQLSAAVSRGHSHGGGHDDLAIMQSPQQLSQQFTELHQLHLPTPRAGTTCLLSNQQQQQQQQQRPADDMLLQVGSQVPQSPGGGGAAAAKAGSLIDEGDHEAKLHISPAAAATEAVSLTGSLASVPQVSPAAPVAALVASVAAVADVSAEDQTPSAAAAAAAGVCCRDLEDCNVVTVDAQRPVDAPQSPAAAQVNEDQVGAVYDNVTKPVITDQPTTAAADVAHLSCQSAVEYQATGSLSLATAAAAAAMGRPENHSQHGVAQLDTDEYADGDVVMATPDDDGSADADANLGQLQDLIAVDHHTAAAAGPMHQGTREPAAGAATGAADVYQAQEAMAMHDDMAAPTAAAASGSPATAAAYAAADVDQAHEAMAVDMVEEAMAVDGAFEAAPIAALASGSPAASTGCATAASADQSQEAMEVDHVVTAAAPSATPASSSSTSGIANEAQEAMGVIEVVTIAAAAASGGPRSGSLVIAAAAAAAAVTSEQRGSGAASSSAVVVAITAVPRYNPLAAAPCPVTGPELNDQQQVASLQLLMGSPCDNCVDLFIGSSGIAATAVGQDTVQELVDATAAAPAVNAADLASGGVNFAVSGLSGGSSEAAAALEPEYDDAGFTQGLQLVLSDDGNDD